jgi:hypothetical protein
VIGFLRFLELLPADLFLLCFANFFRSDSDVVSVFSAEDCKAIVAPFLRSLHRIDDLRLDFLG